MATDYGTLENKPTINGVELTPNTTLEDIGIHELSEDEVSEMIKDVFGVLL